MDMDIGLKYQAINQGQVDVMTIFLRQMDNFLMIKLLF